MDLSKTILFVGGGIETVPGVRLARSMGLRVLVSDRNPKAPCFALADASLSADTYSTQQTLARARDYSNHNGPIHGVICLGTDVPLTVAGVAQALGLPGLKLETAELAMDKLAMKDRFAAAGVPIPRYHAVRSAEHLKTLSATEPGPLVLKPVDSRGARGVLRLGPDADLEQAYHYAHRFSPTGRVMVEAYLEGPQISTESLVLDGIVHTPGFSDRNYELLDAYAPFFIENGGDLPSFLPPEAQQAVKTAVAAAAAALGVDNGVVKGDVVFSNGQPYIIEIATRLSGGYFCTHSIPRNTGVDLVGQAIRLAVGEPVSAEALQPTRNQHVCQRYLFPQPGRVQSIEGAEAVAALPHIDYCEIRVAPGDLIAPIENHPGRAGVLAALGSSRQEAIHRAEDAVRRIRINTR